jgi:hypothetical protein
LENLDQAIDVMYDPLRHKPVNDKEGSLIDDLEIFDDRRSKSYACMICQETSTNHMRAPNLRT